MAQRFARAYQMLTYWPMKSAVVPVVEIGDGTVGNFLPGVMDVHQHLLAFFRMAIFGAVFAFGRESSEKMACFMSHRAVGSTVGDQGDAFFGIGGPFVGLPSVRQLPNEKKRQRGS